jgi:hypothetical protein
MVVAIAVCAALCVDIVVRGPSLAAGGAYILVTILLSRPWLRHRR